MKKEQILIVIFVFISLLLLAWALQLNSSLKNLRQEKNNLEMKFSQVVKERDFMKARMEELEKKLEEERKATNLINEKLDQAENTIRELEEKIVNLTKEKEDLEKKKEDLEKELASLKSKETTSEGTLETPAPQTSLPRETAPIEENLPEESVSPF